MQKGVYVAHLVAMENKMLPFPWPCYFLAGFDPGHDDPKSPMFIGDKGIAVACPGGGVARFTIRMEDALQFPLKALLEFVRTIHPLHPRRPDGGWNRPLTANSFLFGRTSEFKTRAFGWETTMNAAEHAMCATAIEAKFGSLQQVAAP